jgi:hypothetical protein
MHRTTLNALQSSTDIRRCVLTDIRTSVCVGVGVCGVSVCDCLCVYDCVCASIHKYTKVCVFLCACVRDLLCACK